jgi:hypothetical protein
MTQPQLPPSAAAYFRDLERRLTEMEKLRSQLPVPHGPTLPNAAERANQLFVLDGPPPVLHYSNGVNWTTI